MINWPLEDLSQIYGLNLKNPQLKNKILYLESSIGPLALKRSTLTPKELELQVSILGHLSSKGYNSFSAIVPTLSGKGFAEIDEQIFLITTWVQGYHPDFNRPIHLELGARTLATFHRAATGYHGPVFWQKRKLYGVWPMRFSYRLSHIQWYRGCIVARGIQDEFDQVFMENVDRYLLQGYRVVEELRNPAYYALASQARNLGTVCHHDVAYHNILIDLNKHTWLIDFDYCILDMQVHDLANMILRHVKYTSWCLEDISRILLMYHNEKPLLSAELDALISFLKFPQDFWQVAWAKYNEISMHKSETLLLRLKRLVDTEKNRQHFLAELSSLVRNKNFLPGRDTL